ncbi:hypothetical protein WR25_10085 isoform D [Diploscapter pachys]|nr:hypothetical protein WR25_10085 isoform C [Diploscapter pachys]PAV84835.1 hypothetical protein WR25_10085 isoform D [Diploscapter pachys]
MGSNYKSRLVLSMSAAVQLRDQFDAMIKFSDSVPEGQDKEGDSGLLKSETLTFDSRRYYLDLKENQRGRFLRIAQTVVNPRASRAQVKKFFSLLNNSSFAFQKGRRDKFPKSKLISLQIAIPASGMKEMREAISEMLDKYSEGYLNQNGTNDNGKSKVVQAETKTFYLDVGENDRGVFVRISEVKISTGFRQSITVPSTALEKIRSALDEVIAEVNAKSTA